MNPLTQMLLWLSRQPPQVEQGAPLRAWRPRGGFHPDQILFHESVTRTREDTVQQLRARKLGVHFIISRDGSISSHVPLTRATVHAIDHNERAVAVEWVNPYYGARAIPGQRVIAADWAHKGRYIVPPQVQLEAGWRLLRWLLLEVQTVPATFPTVSVQSFRWGRSKQANQPGVLAHHAFDHADGLFPLHYCLCRKLGLDSEAAMVKTLEAAQARGRWTQLPDHDDGES